MSDTRSLWDIISSCLITLFACTYVSVHPNVPSPNATQLTIFFTRIKLMILALLVPEIILAWAARQWHTARSIQKGQLFYPHYQTRTRVSKLERIQNPQTTRLLSYNGRLCCPNPRRKNLPPSQTRHRPIRSRIHLAPNPSQRNLLQK